MQILYRVFTKRGGRLIAEKSFSHDDYESGKKWATPFGGWALEAYREDGSTYAAWEWVHWNSNARPEGAEEHHTWGWHQLGANCLGPDNPRWPIDYKDWDTRWSFPDDYFINKYTKQETLYRQRKAIGFFDNPEWWKTDDA